MLYRLLKIIAPLACKFYCRDIRINAKEMLQVKGPLLLAVNHPNSFLDAVILATLFRQPVYSLARGDSFNNKTIARMLKALNILPVYRVLEGAQHLHKNYDTFDTCMDIFKKGGIVLIFTEALCENEWHLRPLKKGTARLAAAAWQQNIPVKILPVALNYSSFHLFGKNVQLNFGTFIEKKQPSIGSCENGKLLMRITSSIQEQLQPLVHEIDKADKATQAKIFTVPVSNFKRIFLAIPAAIGYLLHWPIYRPLQVIVLKKVPDPVHIDSAMAGSLLILYPFYLLLAALLLYFIAGGFWWTLVFVIMPFTAWSFVQLKKQLIT